ncbi:MAG: hypothetical protein GX574_15425 [Lentisphaerae bacterium]|nr:hypothetical protein [Lentisphaerota bacterium]
MKKMLGLMLTVSIGLSMATALGDEAKKKSEAALSSMKTVLTVTSLRKQAIENSAVAVKTFFQARAEMRWQRIASEYSEEQLNDFFQGTVYLGAADLSYAALYNPWWDAILLLNLVGLPDVPKVENFCFVSGGKFRGDAQGPPSVLEGTVPQANPYAVDLWSLASRTVKHYQERFTGNERAEFVRLQPNDPADTERIQVRSAVRLRLLLKFIQNKTMQREARRIAKYLTAGNEAKMRKYFKGGGGADFVGTFAKVPGELRENFIPYCYFPGKEGTLFVFFNADMPRIFVTVTYPRKGFDRIMEWYDLQAADKFLQVWNSAKKEEK